MISSVSQGLLHHITGLLLEPIIWLLLFFIVLTLFELGMLAGEYFGGIKKLVQARRYQALVHNGRLRIERADFITRLAPMLGLMGTLIPLGPGLAALGDGNLKILTTAITVAFDTTVVGLLVGMAGFVLGRVRRRWYDNAIAELETLPFTHQETQARLAGQTALTTENHKEPSHE